MSLFELDENARSECLRNFGQTEKNVEVLMGILREWLNKQPHLPHDVSDQKLFAFLAINKFNVEKTKNKLDMYFCARSSLPQFFETTYAASEKMQKAFDVNGVAPMPKKFKNQRIVCFKALDPNPDLYDPVAAHSMACQICEVMLEEDLAIGAILVFDLSNFTIGHITKLDVMFLRDMKVVMELYGGRILGIHLIHNSSYITTFVKVTFSLMKQKLVERVHIHSTFEDLHKEIPREFLPVEFEGTSVSIVDIMENWKKKLIQYDPYLQKLNAFKVDPNLRPKHLISDQFLDIQGSFRKLELD